MTNGSTLPWGKRRSINGTTTEGDGVVDDHGYTGHEMLDQLALVHMNGRVYDPVLGRFLSADPYIQAPENGQSYNRYSYVWNDPVNMQDPTGYSADKKNCDSPEECNLPLPKLSISNEKSEDEKRAEKGTEGKQKKNKSEGTENGQSANTTRNDIVRDAALASPNPSVSQSAACVGHDGACAGGLASMFGGGWLAATKLGRAMLALIGFGSEVQGMADGVPVRLGAAGAVPAKVVINAGSEVAPTMIRAALAGDKTLSMQGAVSLPAVQRYVDRLLAGEVAPAIKMDGQILVDGNHRYIAGKLLGQTPEVTVGAAPASRAATAKPISEIKVDPADWGNH